MECNMDGHVAPEGFCDWDAERKVSDRCGEWRSEGTGGKQHARHPAQKRLTNEEAAEITVRSVLGGEDGWNPASRSEYDQPEEE